VTPPIVSFGGTFVGGTIARTATFSNIGNAPLTINAVHRPSAPFDASGAPQAGDTIAAGASITVDVSFAPTQTGQFDDQIGLDTTGGNLAIGLSGSAGTPGLLRISTETNDYGSVAVGATAAKTFTITNAGGTAVTIMKSKPPFGGDFAATTSLEEGTTIAPGAALSESVAFTPTSTAPSTGTWLITGDDGSGLHTVQFTGSGATTLPASNPPPQTPPPQTPAPQTQTQTQTPGPPIIAPPHPTVLVGPKVVPNVASAARLASLYIVYTAALAHPSRFTLERLLTGRRTGRACARPTLLNRRRPRCTTFVRVAAFSHVDSVGAVRLALTHVVSSRKLVPGTYLLRSVSVDAAGRRRAFDATFRVTR
jgi:hypothetical protein